MKKSSAAAVNAGPTFRGGEDALARYITENLEYPSQAIRKGQEGTVIVSFYINADGSVEDIKIKKSVSEELDHAAISFIKAMPRWTPAIQNNQPQRVNYTFPITYSLNF